LPAFSGGARCGTRLVIGTAESAREWSIGVATDIKSAKGTKTAANQLNTEGANDMIKKFFNDETGLELSEYAVAAALVALAVITAFTTLGTNIGSKITNLAGKVGT
jgi:pilus assembly protein Flp/PilA